MEILTKGLIEEIKVRQYKKHAIELIEGEIEKIVNLFKEGGYDLDINNELKWGKSYPNQAKYLQELNYILLGVRDGRWADNDEFREIKREIENINLKPY